jgi:hypothetical protein
MAEDRRKKRQAIIQKNSSFGDRSNDTSFQGGSRAIISNTKRLANDANVGLGGRTNASDGSLGTTTGDNSGTGVNTPAKRGRRRSKIRGTLPQDARLGAANRASPERQVSDLAKRLRRNISSGKISARAAGGIEADLIKTLATSQSGAAGRASAEGIAANRLGFEQNKSVADRQESIRSQFATAESNLDLENARQGGQDRRSSVDAGIAQERNDIGRERLGQDASLAEQAQSNSDRQFELDRAVAGSTAQADAQQQFIENRNARTALQIDAFPEFNSEDAREALGSRLEAEQLRADTPPPEAPSPAALRQESTRLLALKARPGNSAAALRDIERRLRAIRSQQR